MLETFATGGEMPHILFTCSAIQTSSVIHKDKTKDPDIEWICAALSQLYTFNKPNLQGGDTEELKT
jgi:hypothetical protein